MKFDDPIRAVLARKGTDVISVPLGASVYEALGLMADHDIGAVIVEDRGMAAGILSERDYARKVILLGRSSADTSVSEVMSAPVFAAPRDTIDACLRSMTERRLRHIVVVEGSRVVGIVSIGDLVNWMLSVQADTIEHLSHYVTGAYPA